MKKRLLTLAALAMLVMSSYSQGTITFQYFGAGVGETPILYPDGTTPVDSSFTVGLYLTSNLNTPLATTEIFQQTGLFQFNGPDIVVPGTLAGQNANLTIRVWKTSAGSFDNTALRGQESFISAPLGGQNPTPPPPALTPPDLSGPATLGFDGILLPEPSTYALGIAGFGALASFRRRN